MQSQIDPLNLIHSVTFEVFIVSVRVLFGLGTLNLTRSVPVDTLSIANSLTLNVNTSISVEVQVQTQFGLPNSANSGTLEVITVLVQS